MRKCLIVAVVLAGLIAGCSGTAERTAGGLVQGVAELRTGDEGMWTLDNLPVGELKQRYGFEPTAEWVRHVQLSAISFGGASGAFVSPEGLVLTNHHVGLGQLQKLSTPEKDYVRDGFCARTREEELRCPDQELRVLVSMEDVSQRVFGAVDAKGSDEQQNRQRKAEIARIEKESTEQTGLKSTVVSLYDGGEYWLYRYKQYTDVRLVMAPEFQAAFFGGDFDNFTYPRFCLDFAFFRVYEDGKPARIEHYLKLKAAGPKEGELVFVAGHPGSTDRQRTVAQLEFDRDYALPMSLRTMAHLRRKLGEYAARGPEQARQVQSMIFGVENGIKAVTGRSEGLKNPAVFERLKQRERALRQEVKKRPELARSTGDPWGRLARATRKAAERHKESTYARAGRSRLAGIAAQIVSYVVEVEKPNDQRYEEFRDSALESLKLRLFSPAPIYPELEEFLLADALSQAREALGADHRFVAAALGGREPAAVARELIGGTRLGDPKVRRELVEGGRQAVERSTDPLIVWARRLDAYRREQREWYENNIQSVEALEGRKIARARFAVYGRNTYPDATGTLRLSFGRAMGYELGTTRVPFKTTFFGLYDRAASFDAQSPFDLAPTVKDRRGYVQLDTPLNFVSTNDIIGGNSGSPVVNREGQYVGLIFDSNIFGLVGSYVYDDVTARAVSVHAGAIIEALEHIYPMPQLVGELLGQ